MLAQQMGKKKQREKEGKMKRKKQVLFLVAFMFGLTLWLPSISTSAEKVMVFGQTDDLTGVTSALGITNKRTVEMMVDEINKAGGVKVKGDTYKLKVICEDNKNTTEGGTAAANKLVYQDKVKIMMNFLTTPCLASQMVTEPAKVLNLLSGLHPDILSPKKPYSFRYFVSSTEMAPLTVQWFIKNRPTIKTNYMVLQDDASGLALMEAWIEACKKYGLKMLGHDYISISVTDFYPLLSKILALNPDMIGVNNSPPGATLVKQAREKGFKGHFQSGWAWDPTLIESAGATNAEGLIHPGLDMESQLIPERLRDFTKNYRKKYNEEPAAWAAWVAAVPFIIAQAAEKAGTVDNVDKLKAVIEKEWFDTPWGKVRFGGKNQYGIGHQMLHPVFISAVKAGKTVIVERIDSNDLGKSLGYF